MNRTKLPTLLSLLFLVVVLVIAVSRQLSNSDDMSHFKTTQIELGGESHPVLQTLRQKQTVKLEDIETLLPKRSTFTPQKPIFISRHEVTNLQYRRFINQTLMKRDSIPQLAHPSIEANHDFRPKSLNDVKYSGNRQPVVNVSWQDAYAFCRFINMRLPTANEFEATFGIEAGLRQPKEFDYPLLPGSEKTAFGKITEVVPTNVGKYQSSKGIFHDIIGNVMEWVLPQDSRHMLMGYSYKQYGKDNELANFYPWKRFYSPANTIGNDFGFRCVYEPANVDFLQNLSNAAAQPSAMSQDGVNCWDTKTLLGPGRFDLINEHNKPHHSGGRLFPDEMCQLPQKTYHLGPDKELTTVDLIQQNPIGFARYLLGKSPNKQTVSAFWLDRSEVTVADFTDYLNLSDVQAQIHAHPEASKTRDSHPLVWTEQLQDTTAAVTGVSWWDAFAYCSWRNKRLPFASEWESAVRGADNRMYAWGDDFNQTNAVDITPNKVSGLSKNVSEWTSTFIVGSDTAIVKGGSSFFDWKIFGRAYTELKVSRSTQSPSIGFRCAQSG